MASKAAGAIVAGLGSIEAPFESIRFAIVVELGTNDDNIAMSIACEFPWLAFLLIEPFAHFGHLDGEIGRSQPD